MPAKPTPCRIEFDTETGTVIARSGFDEPSAETGAAVRPQQFVQAGLQTATTERPRRRNPPPFVPLSVAAVTSTSSTGRRLNS